MTPELAAKVFLITRIPEFRDDLEKTASALGLNDQQKAEVVLRSAHSIDLGRIEKQAAPTGPGGWLIPVLAGILGGGVAGTTAGYGYANPTGAAAQAYERGLNTPQPGKNIVGAGVGGLGGGALGAFLGNQLSDGGQLGTGIGAGLGAAGGAGLGSYIEDLASR